MPNPTWTTARLRRALIPILCFGSIACGARSQTLEPISYGSDLVFHLGEGTELAILARPGGVELFASTVDRVDGKRKFLRRFVDPSHGGLGEILVWSLHGDEARQQILELQEVAKIAVLALPSGPPAWAVGGLLPDGRGVIRYDFSSIGLGTGSMPTLGEPGFLRDPSLSSLLASVTTPSTRPIEPASWTEALAHLDHQVRTYKHSSSDPEGHNNDGFGFANGAFALRTTTRNGHVLMEDQGPGVVSSIFFQPPDHTIATAAALSQSLEIFLDGPNATFSFPTAGTLFDQRPAPFDFRGVDWGNGGFWSYLPLPYRTGARIEASRPTFHHIVFTKGNFVPDRPAWEEILRRGANNLSPHGISSDLIEHHRLRTTLAPLAGPTPVLSLAKPGVVLETLARVIDPSRDWQDVWIRITWDGAATPQVHCPLGLLFGAAQVQFDLETVLFQEERNALPAHSARRSYYPMPFRSTALVELENRSSRSIAVDLDLGLRPGHYPEPFGYFHVQTRLASPTIPGLDHGMLDLSGWGKFMGSTMEITLTLSSSQDSLEGDQRIFVDFGEHPTHHNTGTEDQSNWGFWGQPAFDSHFTHPTHAYSGPVLEPPLPSIPMYLRRGSVRHRLFFDPVPYYGSIRVGQEHGPFNWGIVDYQTAAYAYHQDTPALRHAFSFAPTNPQDILRRNYRSSQPGTPFQVTSWNADERRQTTMPWTKTGQLETGNLAFTIDGLSPKHTGVLLRAEIDRYGPYGPSRMQVLVDGHDAGTLNLPWDVHYRPQEATRFAEVELDLPYHLTAGRDRLEIELVPVIPHDRSQVGPWPVYAYHVFEYVR
ncbi:MAG: DUF2961 domain-containing protein [Planctomycetes bacterium]|nr:DUF2961 domain-containing protein [Planctomycetota bacterium]